MLVITKKTDQTSLVHLYIFSIDLKIIGLCCKVRIFSHYAIHIQEKMYFNRLFTEKFARMQKKVYFY